LNDLFLVRMVAHGDYNLEAYLMELEDAYYGFEESYGNPDKRVAIVSLRDDIFAIPRLSDTGEILTQAQRIEQLRQRIKDNTLIDDSGYISIPFSTDLALLSPLTRNHKIDYVEAEIVGTDVGDTVGRVYLRQTGTSTVRSVEGEKLYFAFPSRTAVVDTVFNGTRVFPADLYQNFRFKDRPFANTRWDLLINQKDETVNKDIDLQSITDVKIYIYYTDFTQLD
jgi:hypothetical protein